MAEHARVAESVTTAAPVPLVSVVVVSWNTRDLLTRCLASLAGEVERGRAEVWVVDNASSDGSPDVVREHFPWAHLVALTENIGFGRAVNLGASRSRGAWLAVANADIALRDGALDALFATADRDPRAGALAPRLVLSDGTTQHSVFAFPSVPFAFVLATALSRLWGALGDRYALPGYWDSSRARRVPWAIAAFLLVRRQAWDEVGGFDERQFVFAEDLDLGWRLREAGWFTRYEPRAVVDHVSSASTTQLFGPELAPHWQRSTYGFIARRRGVLRTWAVALLNFTGAVARSGLNAGLAVTRSDGYAERRDAFWRWALVHLRALRGRATLERLQ